MKKINYDNMYNVNYKRDFIDSYGNSHDSKVTVTWVFKKSHKLEKKLNKDLLYFNIDEFNKLMKLCEFKTSNSARSYGRIISSYLSWGVENSYIDKSLFKGKKDKWFDQFVEETKEFLTKNEIIKLENDLVNAQDSVIIRLIFEGVRGQELEEIINIKESDIDKENNTILLHDYDGSKRTIEVSDRCIDLIEKAFNETEYYNKNGLSGSYRKKSKLVQSDYLIKPNLSVNAFTSKPDKNLIYRRISAIKRYFNINFFNTDLIQKSGMLYHLSKYYYIKNEITKEDLKLVYKIFNINVTNHTNNLYKDVLNEENILNMYPRQNIDIESMTNKELKLFLEKFTKELSLRA